MIIHLLVFLYPLQSNFTLIYPLSHLPCVTLIIFHIPDFANFLLRFFPSSPSQFFIFILLYLFILFLFSVLSSTYLPFFHSFSPLVTLSMLPFIFPSFYPSLIPHPISPQGPTAPRATEYTIDIPLVLYNFTQNTL